MSADDKLVTKQGLLPISPDDAAEMTAVVREIFFGAAPGTELNLVQARLAQLDDQAVAEAAPLRRALQSSWNFFQGCGVMLSSDFVAASNLFEAAASGFDQLGQTTVRDISLGMGVYSRAVIQLQQKNIGQAQELLRQVRQYLQEASQYTNRYELIVDMFEPEGYFVAGVSAWMELDYAQATVLMTKASQTVERFADKYFRDNDATYKYYRGLGRCYQAHDTFLSTFSNYNQFQFARVSARLDLTSDARQAKTLISESKLDNAIARSLIAVMDVIIPLEEVVTGLSATMLSVLDSTFKPNLKAQTELRKKIQVALDAASKAGPQAQIFVRFCEQLRNQVDNLEALAKPKKKDFGIFSGLVSCALFLPMFLLISWANSAFNVQLDGKEILRYSLFPALVGGFGLGAIKFWRAFSPSGKGSSK